MGDRTILAFVAVRAAGGLGRLDMDEVRWGVIGCGDVTEVKSGPGFQQAAGSSLVAVMRRDGAKAADYARRHGVPRWYDRALDLIRSPAVNAVYVATPPGSHCELAIEVAAAGKPCLVEKPMARGYGECLTMLEAFRTAGVPLFVAYYRRALPRFLKVRELLKEGRVGKLTSVRICLHDRLASGDRVSGWRFDPVVAGGGLLFDVGSHGIDLLDFFCGPIGAATGFAVNSGAAYEPEDVTAACFEFESGVVGTGIWNFNADQVEDEIALTGTWGSIRVPVFADGSVVVECNGAVENLPFRNPVHVHGPLIQSVVDELLGRGTCESTGVSGARASRVMELCVRGYYDGRRSKQPRHSNPGAC